MGIDIYKLIDQHSVKFDEWYEALRKAHPLLSEDPEGSRDYENLRIAAIALGDISTIFFKYGAFKDNFDNEQFAMNLYGVSIIIQSEKLGSRFDFGTDEEGIYLNTHILNSNQLQYMDDEFWMDLLNLSNYGEFELNEYEHFRKG